MWSIQRQSKQLSFVSWSLYSTFFIPLFLLPISTTEFHPPFFFTCHINASILCCMIYLFSPLSFLPLLFRFSHHSTLHLCPKANVNITSKHDGVITKLYYQPSDIVKVGSVIFDIEAEGKQEELGYNWRYLLSIFFVFTDRVWKSSTTYHFCPSSIPCAALSIYSFWPPSIYRRLGYRLRAYRRGRPFYTLERFPGSLPNCER